MISRSLCPLDASGDADNTVLYSCCPPYGSSRTARYLDADNSFSVLLVSLFFLLLCLVCRALLLPLSPTLSRIPSSFFLFYLFILLFCREAAVSRVASPHAHTISTRRPRVCAYARVHANVRVCFITVNHRHSFFRFFFSPLSFLNSTTDRTPWPTRAWFSPFYARSLFLPSVTMYLRSSTFDRTRIINVEIYLCGISRNAMKISLQVANFPR